MWLSSSEVDHTREKHEDDVTQEDYVYQEVDRGTDWVFDKQGMVALLDGDHDTVVNCKEQDDKVPILLESGLVRDDEPLRDYKSEADGFEQESGVAQSRIGLDFLFVFQFFRSLFFQFLDLQVPMIFLG